MRVLIAAAALAACSSSSFAAGIARVDFAIGNVTAVAPDGRSRQLSRGSEIDVGDTVNTQQGRAQLRFSDGAYMSLQPQTEFKVDEFKFSGKQADPSDNIVMSLLKGGMRTITGLIGRANRNNYRLRTDVATIGIRGTEYSVKYTNSIEVFCADGSIFLQNDGGILQLNGGQGGYVASNDTPPQQTENRPNLPPESPVNQELLEQEDVTDPVNPIQEANPPIPLAATLLTGAVPLNTALAGYDTCGDFCFNVLSMPDSSGELDSAGRLIAFGDPAGQNPPRMTTVGTASIADAGNDGIVAWGRWTNGVLAGDGDLGGDGFTADLTNSGISLHYVVGTPTPLSDISALQGQGTTATYSLLGATSPTTRQGDVGSVTGGQLVAHFGSMQVDMTLSLSIASRSYGISAAGMQISGSEFSGGGTASGCQFQCSTSVAGFFAGPDAARAGTAYRINDGGSSTSVFGTAAFVR
jgi:hypothetical protein